MHTIKPLDREAILQAAAETRGIVTAEEHHLTGGLGGAVAELLAVEHPTRMRLVGMPDDFAVVGPTVPLRAKYGMSAEAIARPAAACYAQGEGGAYCDQSSALMSHAMIGPTTNDTGGAVFDTRRRAAAKHQCCAA